MEISAYLFDYVYKIIINYKFSVCVVCWWMYESLLMYYLLIKEMTLCTSSWISRHVHFISPLSGSHLHWQLKYSHLPHEIRKLLFSLGSCYFTVYSSWYKQNLFYGIKPIYLIDSSANHNAWWPNSLVKGPIYWTDHADDFVCKWWKLV